MNRENQVITDGVSSQTHLTQVKETYHAPQIKVHGKLERLTLQGNYVETGGGGSGGTGNTVEE